MTSLWDAVLRVFSLDPTSSKRESVQDIVSHIGVAFSDSCDLSCREIKAPAKEHQVTVLYLESLTDPARLSREVIEPLLTCLTERSSPAVTASKTGLVESAEHAINLLLNGHALITIKERNLLIHADVATSVGRSIATPSAESTIAGPQDSFVERIGINLTLVRQRLRTPTLKCLKYTIGEKTNMALYLLYLEGISPEDMVSDMKDRLAKLHIGEILDISYLESLIGVSPLSPFPQSYYTQRPDKVVGNLLEGRLAILLDGSANALITPTAFADLFQSPEDYYARSTTTVMVRLLRIIGFVLATMLPALYISVISFDLEILPVALSLPVATFRAGIPFSPVIETLLMVLIVDILQEGSTRIPAKIGQTVGVVGGFILGQAVIQAKLVSPLLVIVVATSVIGSFSLPNYELNALVRLIRYLFILGAATLSGVGVAIVWSALFIHMSSLEILGIPYLRPIAPLRLQDHSDFIYHSPYRNRKPGLSKRLSGNTK